MLHPGWGGLCEVMNEIEMQKYHYRLDAFRVGLFISNDVICWTLIMKKREVIILQKALTDTCLMKAISDI